MEVQARAKLNLTLDVLGKRPDGYHDLKMVMQSITLADTLTLEEQAYFALGYRQQCAEMNRVKAEAFAAAKAKESAAPNDVPDDPEDEEE